MTKQELINELLDKKVVRVQVLSIPDWNGGCDPKCFILGSGERPFGYGKDEVNPNDFEYIEFNGDVTHAIRHLNATFNGHKEPCYEDSYDYMVTLKELIEEQLKLW